MAEQLALPMLPRTLSVANGCARLSNSLWRKCAGIWRSSRPNCDVGNTCSPCRAQPFQPRRGRGWQLVTRLMSYGSAAAMLTNIKELADIRRGCCKNGTTLDPSPRGPNELKGAAPAWARDAGHVRGSIGRRLLGGTCRMQNHRQRADTLSAVDQHTFDIRGGRWSGHKHTVPGVELRAFAISVVQVADNALGIQQNDEVLRKKAEAIDFELFFGQPHRTRLRHPIHRPHDRHIDGANLSRASHTVERQVSKDLRRRRAHDPGIREELPDEFVQIAVGGRCGELAAHPD